MAFPLDPQDVYVDLPLDVVIGDFWEGDALNQITARCVLAEKTKVSQITTCTVVPTNGDELSVIIDGAQVPAIISTADATATALLLEAAIEAVALFPISGVEPTGGDFAINFSDSAEHTVVAFSPATADVTPIVLTQAAVDQVKLHFGDVVVSDTSVITASGTPVTSATSVGQTILGVLGRMPGCDITPEMLRLQGYSVDHLQPARAYPLTTEKGGIVVGFFGAAPTVSDPVYAKMTGPVGDPTLYGVTDGGVSEVVTYTVTTSASDDIAFDIDGLTELLVAATNVVADDAASLVAEWRADASYLALSGGAGGIVDNLDGTFTVSYVGTTTHVLTDSSTGTNAVDGVVDTAAVAAFARLLPNSSWGRPTNTATTPPQAYLRVDVRAN